MCATLARSVPELPCSPSRTGVFAAAVAHPHPIALHRMRHTLHGIVTCSRCLHLGLYGTAGNTIHTLDHIAAFLLQAMMDVQDSRANPRENAAVQIQAAWRGTAVGIQLHKQRQAAVVVQALWRGRQVRVAVLRRQRAALLLQALWRARAVRHQAARQLQAALQLQARWKSRDCRRRYLRNLSAIIKVPPLLFYFLYCFGSAMQCCMRLVSWLARLQKTAQTYTPN